MEDAVRPGHSSTKLTYADYVLLPDDGLRHEIIEGEHYVTAAPVTRHQRISGRLFYLIQDHLEAHPIGEVFAAPFDVLLSEINVFVPDLVYVSKERSRLITEKNLQGAPDLAIEILSPSTKSRDERLKRDVYQRTGVDEYWLVDPDRNVIQVYRQSGGGFGQPVQYGKADVLTTPLLPGFQLSLDRVLA
jgi:Uma2 family endonuclease